MQPHSGFTMMFETEMFETDRWLGHLGWGMTEFLIGLWRSAGQAPAVDSVS